MTEEDAVTIEELDIVHAPGFETDGFVLNGFSPGINLVYGPNGAGKTTTANSIEGVLWPDTADNGEQLVGQLSLNGDQWRVEAKNGHGEYQQNGQESTAPSLPSIEQRDRYRLSLYDLLQQDTRNESFAETIERASAGGYDLVAAAEELGYKDSPISRRKGVFQDAKDAVEVWQEEQNETKGLEEERSRLTKLRSELDAAKQARDEKDALEQAITYREARAAFNDAKSSLNEFPDVLSKVTGDELQQVENLDEDIQKWQREKEAAVRKQEDATSALDEATLPDNGVSDGTVTGLKQRQDELEDHETRKKRLEEKLEGAKTERKNVCEEIPLDVERNELTDIDPGAWADVSEFARKALEVQAVKQTRDAIKQWADKEEPPIADPQSVERASSALVEWLTSVPGPKSGNEGNSVFYMGTVSGLIVLVAGVMLGALVNPLLFSVILVGLGLIVYGYLNRREPESGGNERDAYRRTFEQTGVEPPASWTEDGVRERLVEMYDDLAHHQVVEERREKRDTLLAEQDIETKEQQLVETRETLREKLGAVPDISDVSDVELAVIVQRILKWQDANDEVVRLQEELTETNDNLQQVRDTLQLELGEYGYLDIEDAAAVKAAIRDLEQRKTKHETATSDLADAETAREKAEEKITDLEQQRDAVFTLVDLAPGAHAELQSLCEQVEQYEAAKSEFGRTEAVVEQERQTLEKQPAYDPKYKKQELTELRETLRDVREVAAEHDQIQEEISDIEAEIKKAKTDTAVEEAIRNKESALADLEEELHEDYAAMVGDVLVDQLQEKTIEANRPDVFKRANELLATITHGRYRLDLEENDQTFRAFDTAKQKGFALDELSSGTRVQVLLTVRIAFVDKQERGKKLPVIFDETLANTDDLRADVIINSMIELARDGRQIFYFTAQGDELAKWNKALDEVTDVEWTTIDLANVRSMDRAIQIPDLESVQQLSSDPPDPSGHDHESYGAAIDVQPIDLYCGAGTAHLWYVVNDVEILRDLLAFGIKRWGQLRNLLERGRHEFVPAEQSDIERIEQDAKALEGFVQSWRIGQGKPVDRPVLESSGAISDTFLDRVAALAAELNGDAEKLIDALYAGEVNRFRSGKAEELEEYLKENGYIVTQEPLDDEQIRLRMVERLVEGGVPPDQANERAITLLSRMVSQ